MKQALYTTATIRQLETLAVETATTSKSILMEKAGFAAFTTLQQHWPQTQSLAIVTGKGNNAGDGYVVARLAAKAGWQVTLYEVDDNKPRTPLANTTYQQARQAGAKQQSLTADLILDSDLIIDALLGIGLTGHTLSTPYKIAIQAINRSQSPVLAIDIPSGLCADTGALAEVAVIANITITFIGKKTGLYTAHGPDHSGKIVLAELGLPERLFAQIQPSSQLLSTSAILKLLPPRQKNTHKGHFGHVLCIGGNQGMGGALLTTATAAARVGSGMVSIATHPDYVTANMHYPELLCHGIDTQEKLLPLLTQASVIIIGPGLGLDDWGRALFTLAMTTNKPMVIDADALTLLAEQRPKQNKQSAPRILTPHPGEAAQLLNNSTADIQNNRFQAVKELQQAYQSITVLKGCGTLIQSDANTPTALCPYGNPGMSSAGMGDLLAGIIAGLLAQGLNAQNAAQIGVLLHACAGDLASEQKGERGLLASDLLPYLRQLVNHRL